MVSCRYPTETPPCCGEGSREHFMITHREIIFIKCCNYEMQAKRNLGLASFPRKRKESGFREGRGEAEGELGAARVMLNRYGLNIMKKSSYCLK